MAPYPNGSSFNNKVCFYFSWIGTLLLFSLSFFVSWLFFGTCYYVICYVHGDLEPEHLPANQSDSGNIEKTTAALNIFQKCRA